MKIGGQDVHSPFRQSAVKARVTHCIIRSEHIFRDTVTFLFSTEPGLLSIHQKEYLKDSL